MLFDEKLLYAINNDPSRSECLKQIAMAHTADPAKLSKDLQDIEAQKNILGDEGARNKQSALLYRNLKISSPNTFDFLLYKHDVIPAKWYWWYAREGRSKAAAAAVAVVLLTIFGLTVVGLHTPAHHVQYYVWRMHKANSTDYDRYRARNQLAMYLRTTPDSYSQLTQVLMLPNLPVNTADNVLGLLVESRGDAAAKGVDLQSLLTDCLRTGNSDIRARVQKSLIYLADEKHATVPADLRDWRPEPKDTATDVDTRIQQWRGVTPKPAGVSGSN